MTNLLLELYKTLKKSDEFDVFFVGQHNGEIRRPTVVIVPGSTVPQLGVRTLGVQKVTLEVMTGLNSYLEMEKTIKSVKDFIRNNTIKRDLRKTGYESAIYIHDKKQAYCKDLEYTILRELRK